MKTFYLLIILFFSTIKTLSQSYFLTDVGNTLLLRPNLGFEKMKNKSSYAASLQFQTNAMYWVSEFPGLYKSKGVRADFTYKYFFMKQYFFETKARFQSYEAPKIIKGWKYYSLYNSRSSAEIGFKIGTRMGYASKYQVDLSVGYGLGRRTMPLQISDFEVNQPFKILTEAEILAMYKKIKTFESFEAPYVQINIYRRNKEKAN